VAEFVKFRKLSMPGADRYVGRVMRQV